MGGLSASGFRKIYYGLLSIFACWFALAGIIAASYALGWRFEVSQPFDFLSPDSVINGILAPLVCLLLLSVIMLINGLAEVSPAARSFRTARRWYLVQLVCLVLTALCDGIYVALNNRGMFSDAQQELYLAYYIILVVIVLFGVLASDWMGGRNLLQGYQQVCWDCGVEDARTARLTRTSRQITFSSAVLMGCCSLIVMALPQLYLHASSRYAPPGQLSTYDTILIGTAVLFAVSLLCILMRVFAQIRTLRHARYIFSIVNELSN